MRLLILTFTILLMTFSIVNAVTVPCTSSTSSDVSGGDYVLSGSTLRLLGTVPTYLGIIGQVNPYTYGWNGTYFYVNACGGSFASWVASPPNNVYCATRYTSTAAPAGTTCAWSPNGIKDGDEDGVDCGGSTGITCVPTCPSGYTQILKSNGDETCYKFQPTNPDGSCPTGTTGHSVPYFAQANDTEPSAYIPMCLQSSGPPIPTNPNGPSPLPPTDPTPAPSPTDGKPIDPDTKTSKCTEKTLSDGTVCTTCVSSDGSTRVDCRSSSGTTTTNDTPPTTSTDGDCKTTIYSDGSKCIVCNTNGETTINCLDFGGAPTNSTDSSASDGLLGQIADNTNAMEHSLNGLNTGIRDLNSTSRFTLSTLERTNDLINQLLDKPSGTSTVNVDLSGTNTRLDSINTKLDSQIAVMNEQNAKINEFNDSLKLEKATNHDSTILDIDGNGQVLVDSMDSLAAQSANQIQDDFDPSTFPVSENVTDKLKNVMPQVEICTDVTVNLANKYTMILDCNKFQKFKDMFSWLLYCWTVLVIYETLFTSPKRS